MSVEITAVHEAVNNERAIDKRSRVGTWEMHSWGDGKCSGMAVVSAITTLQIGATLSPIPADQVALNRAAEYLLDALASQLKPFLQALAADGAKETARNQDKAALREQAVRLYRPGAAQDRSGSGL